MHYYSIVHLNRTATEGSHFHPFIHSKDSDIHQLSWPPKWRHSSNVFICFSLWAFVSLSLDFMKTWIHFDFWYFRLSSMILSLSAKSHQQTKRNIKWARQITKWQSDCCGSIKAQSEFDRGSIRVQLRFNTSWTMMPKSEFLQKLETQRNGAFKNSKS